MAESIGSAERFMVHLIFTAAIAFLWVLFAGLSFLPRRRQGAAGGVVMLTKVIYRDGTFGEVDSSRIDELKSEGRIAAYHIYHRWIDVRRKQLSDTDYHGVERRKQVLI
jgi:hypothetical protein